MKPYVLFLSLWAVGLASCVSPGIQGPGGSVQGTANVEELERQAPVTATPSDADNAANAVYYGSGGGYYGRYYGPCGYPGRCNDRRYY